MVYNGYCWMVYGQDIASLIFWVGYVVRPQGLVNIDNSEKLELALYAHKTKAHMHNAWELGQN